MSKKKQKEDNRDIFEKALDNAPAIGGVLGAVAGYAAPRVGARMARRALEKEGKRYTPAQAKALDRDLRKVGVWGAIPTGILGVGMGAGVREGERQRRDKRRK